jgi:hypothetical protein
MRNWRAKKAAHQGILLNPTPTPENEDASANLAASSHSLVPDVPIFQNLSVIASPAHLMPSQSQDTYPSVTSASTSATKREKMKNRIRMHKLQKQVRQLQTTVAKYRKRDQRSTMRQRFASLSPSEIQTASKTSSPTRQAKEIQHSPKATNLALKLHFSMLKSLRNLQQKRAFAIVQKAVSH